MINSIDALKDIEPLIGFGNYEMTYPLIRFDQTLEQWVEEDGLQFNPDFQRGRSWTKDQQIAFIEFVLKGGKTPPILLNHPK